MSDKMMLTLYDLQILAATAARNGTSSNFPEVALQWAAGAQAEIERLREHAVTLAETARKVERERCAKLCDEAREAVWPYHDAEVFKTAQTVCENLANRIRGIGA